MKTLVAAMKCNCGDTCTISFKLEEILVGTLVTDQDDTEYAYGNLKIEEALPSEIVTLLSEETFTVEEMYEGSLVEVGEVEKGSFYGEEVNKSDVKPYLRAEEKPHACLNLNEADLYELEDIDSSDVLDEDYEISKRDPLGNRFDDSEVEDLELEDDD